jgi:hypothetical protein
VAAPPIQIYHPLLSGTTNVLDRTHCYSLHRRLIKFFNKQFPKCTPAVFGQTSQDTDCLRASAEERHAGKMDSAHEHGIARRSIGSTLRGAQ